MTFSYFNQNYRLFRKHSSPGLSLMQLPYP